VAFDGVGNVYVVGTAPDGEIEGIAQKFRVVPSLVPAEMATPLAYLREIIVARHQNQR
jgi:hypothetical protein